MATSLPIVASDVPGIRNLVVPEIGVVAENSGADFAEKVSALIGDEKLMRKLGGVAREVCVEKYSNIRMLSNYIALF
jgi:glycosyltransferase involved in cell wall biosynthesis